MVRKDIYDEYKTKLNVDRFRWEDVVTTFVVNTVAIVLCKAQTLRWIIGLYISPILVVFRGGEGASYRPVWLTANVADRWCYIYVSFCNTCGYRLRSWW